MKPTKREVLEFIRKYNNPKHCAIVTQVPISDWNMELIDGIRDVVCPIHRRWRGPGWKPGFLNKRYAERVSVYPRNRMTSVVVYKSAWSGNPYLTVDTRKYIYG